MTSPSPTTTSKHCVSCDQDLPTDQFYASQERSVWCKSCHSKKSAERADAKRAKLTAIKQSKGCEVCGYNEHPAALHFDHIDPATKTLTISSSTTYSWKRLEAEVAKCRVLCANCHSIHTYNQNYHDKQR